MILRQTRKAAGLTQEEVSRAVGLTQSTYSRFELGQAELDVSELFKLKEFLDKQERTKGTLGYLMGLSPRQTCEKLTEQIAKELEEKYLQREAAELDRQVDVELPALRKKLEHYERLLDRDSQVIRDLMAENDELKKKIRSSNAPTKSPRASKRKGGND